MVSFSSCVSTRAVGLRLFQNEIYLKYKARCFLNNCCHLADTRYRSFNVFRTRVGKLFRSHNTIFPKVHVKTWLRQNNSRIPLHFKGFSASDRHCTFYEMKNKICAKKRRHPNIQKCLKLIRTLNCYWVLLRHVWMLGCHRFLGFFLHW